MVHKKLHIPIVTLDETFNAWALAHVNAEIIETSLPDIKRTQHQASRTVWESGYSYFLLRDKNNKEFIEFPDYIQTICQKAVEALSQETGRTLTRPDAFTNCIVSKYKKGEYLDYHRDISRAHHRYNGRDLNFYLGEQVIGVVLRAETGKHGARLCLQPPENGKAPIYNYKSALQIPEENGTVFLLEGDARNEWYHGVKDGRGQRISLTFRTIEFV